MLSTGFRDYDPDVYSIGTSFTDKISGHHRPPHWKLGTNDRELEPISSILRSKRGLPDPGKYIMDSSFPTALREKTGLTAMQCTKCASRLNAAECVFLKRGTTQHKQARAGCLTQSERTPHWNLPSESRISDCGVLKGVSQKAGGNIPNKLGPGDYEKVKVERFKRVGSAPAFSVGKRTEDDMEIRLRKDLQGRLPPGHYGIPKKSDFDVDKIVEHATGKSPEAAARATNSLVQRANRQIVGYTSTGDILRLPHNDSAWGNMFTIAKRTQVKPTFQRPN